MRFATLQKRNALALAVRREREPGRRGLGVSVHTPEFHALYRSHPYFGYVDVVVDDVPPFVMFSNNDDRVAQMYFWYGPDAFESLSLRIWSRLARAARTIFDVGAYTGVYSLVAAKASRQAEIHAFEPIRRVFGRFIDNLCVNAVGGRVHAHNLALSDAEGDATMRLFRGHLTLSSGSSLMDKPSQEVVDVEPVRTVRADKFAREMGVEDVDLVKVDVEGAEQLVVEGLGDLLVHRPDLLVEVSSPAVLDVLSDRLGPDYDYVVIDERCGPAVPGDRDALRAYDNVLFTAMPRDRLDTLLVEARSVGRYSVPARE